MSCDAGTGADLFPHASGEVGDWVTMSMRTVQCVGYPLENSQLDPENHKFSGNSSLSGRVELLIYWRVT